MARDADLPSLPSSLWRALRLAQRAEPRLLPVSFLLVASAWVPQSLSALWMRFVADGLVQREDVLLALGIGGLAASAALGWLLGTAGGRIAILFSQRVTIAVEAHVAQLQATTAGLEHHEHPEHLDRLQMLKDQTYRLENIYRTLFNLVGAGARLAITVGLLVSVHPVLALLLLFALPAATTATLRQAAQRASMQRAARHTRLARHLFNLCTTPGPGKEIRVTRVGERLAERRRRAWRTGFELVAATRWRNAGWQAATWALFGAGYVAAILFVAVGLDASPGVVAMVAGTGALSTYISSALGQATELNWAGDAARRLAWLEDHAARSRQAACLPAPGRIHREISFDGVSFRYPGTERPVLRDVHLALPAGSVVALVGENGAGKSTLVKLLCRFYEPTEGRIAVDGMDLAEIDAGAWRSRLAGAFQDFMQFEFLARRTVGLGDLPREHAEPAVRTAVARGHATEVVERLPAGLDTQLGRTWKDGVDLSFGQWQKLALARGFMRDEPLLLLLDEPTAALDPETEHELFERFAAEGRAQARDGRITLLVSHRFSTVRMADLIVVVDGGRVVETGGHEELMARRGTYAELYDLQASGYR
jgi:ATP-binding cassette, subfamily B, bacterial